MDWLTQILGTAADTYVKVNASNNSVDVAKAQQLGANGYYTNGQFAPSAGAGISPGILLLMGAALLVFFVVEK